MRIVSWLFGVPLAVVVVVFALSNRQSVSLGLWPLDVLLSIPLSLVLLLALLLGLILGGLVAGLGTVKARLTARRATRRAETLERELAEARASSTTTPGFAYLAAAWNALRTLVMTSTNPIFCALDTQDEAVAVKLAEQLAGLVGGIKLGLEFFIANGPESVRRIAAKGMPLFLDLKLHGIPNTVMGALKGVIALKPAITTLHALGGAEMMRRSMEAAENVAAKAGAARPLIVAVTVLTSIDESALPEMGIAADVADLVKRLAALAQEAGVDGVVCSPREIVELRRQCGPDFKLVVPGIRPAWADLDDQRRVLGPRDAMQAGANVLVIGRPITAAPDPAAAARRILDEIAGKS